MLFTLGAIGLTFYSVLPFQSKDMTFEKEQISLKCFLKVFFFFFHKLTLAAPCQNSLRHVRKKKKNMWQPLKEIPQVNETQLHIPHSSLCFYVWDVVRKRWQLATYRASFMRFILKKKKKKPEEAWVKSTACLASGGIHPPQIITFQEIPKMSHLFSH